MRQRIGGLLMLVAAILAVPAAGYGQEAAVSGTVRDTTGGVLPGAVVRAVHEATGNSFETVTDEAGGFLLPVRVGTYRISAELPGFAGVTRAGLEVLPN